MPKNSRTSPPTRDDLFRRVADGEMSPDEAEAEAQRLALPPLNPIPDPTKFDAERLVHWSFAMAIAWIAWRDLAKVSEFWDDYLRRSFEWKTLQATDGREVTRLVPVDSHGTFYKLSLDADIRTGLDKGPAVPVAAAKQALWQMLQTGDLTAEGIDSQTGRRIEIPAREFQDLELWNLHNGPDRLVSRAPSAVTSYDTPTLRRDSIQKLWPSDAQGLGVATKSSDRPPMKPAYQKIWDAVEAMKQAGEWSSTLLRPFERNKRLEAQMLRMGLQKHEIPHERTIRSFFNSGPGKTEKSG